MVKLFDLDKILKEYCCNNCKYHDELHYTCLSPNYNYILQALSNGKRLCPCFEVKQILLEKKLSECRRKMSK